MAASNRTTPDFVNREYNSCFSFRPHKVKVLLPKRRINVIILVIIVIFLIWDGEGIISRDITENMNEFKNKPRKQCVIVHTFLTQKQVYVKEILTELLASAVPISILLPLNFAIVVKVHIIFVIILLNLCSCK